MKDRINRIKIDGLFGFLDHNISLKDGGITFIHGPNGCGKTTVLKLISNLFSWKINQLLDTPFSELTISYQDDVQLKVIKYFKEILPNEEDDPSVLSSLIHSTLIFQLEKEGNVINSLEIGKQVRDRFISSGAIEEEYPFLHRVGPREWFNEKTGSYVSHNYVMDNYGIRDYKSNQPKWIAERIDSSKLHFIQTQRLLKVGRFDRDRHPGSSTPKIKDVIQIYSEELKNIISNKLLEFGVESQSKSRSFPERLLLQQTDPNITEDIIRQNYKKTEDKIQALMNIGLIDQEQTIELPKKQLEASERKVLSLYIQDSMEKLAIFDDLQKKIETFVSIISPKLRNKDFTITRSEGFVFTPNQGNRCETFSPSQLSSGEQHEIVLFYELIFKSDNNSLFLIDEPEISLHVDWQRQFLSDLLKITELGKCYFIVATHSPQIIGNRRDLSVALDGGILNDSTQTKNNRLIAVPLEGGNVNGK